MIRSLWIAKTGLDVQQTHLDTISNNLAICAPQRGHQQRASPETLRITDR